MTLEVSITSDDGKLELGKIRIDRIETHLDGTADYSVKFVADRYGAVGIHQRVVYGYPRTEYNALALVLQALNTLEPEELKLEEVDSPDMARRLYRALPAFPGEEASGLHHNRPPFWRR